MSQNVCQSCGMPLEHEEQYGNDKQNNKVQDYCKYCYEKGEFTNPNSSLEEMIEICVPFMVQDGMEEQAARTMMTNYLPNLKRWSSQENNNNKIIKPFTIIEKPEFHLVGIATRTSNGQEMTESGVIPKLWDRFSEQSILQHIPNQSEPNTIYGCYTDYENEAFGQYTLLLGTSVNAIDVLPEGMTVIKVPAAKYAVFTTRRGPFSEVVVEAWQAIWSMAASSVLERIYTGDFELYDERSLNPEEAEVDIYIAIK